MQEVTPVSDGKHADTPAAVQTQVQQKLAELQRQVAQAASGTLEAKQKRRTLLADISSCTGESTVSDPVHRLTHLQIL